MQEPPDGHVRLKSGYHLKPHAKFKLLVSSGWVDAELSSAARVNRRTIGARWYLDAPLWERRNEKVSIDRVAAAPDAIEGWALFEYDLNGEPEEQSPQSAAYISGIEDSITEVERLQSERYPDDQYVGLSEAADVLNELWKKAKGSRA